jgi:hypothetical protein
MNTSATYQEFKYKASEIKRYIEAVGLFSILLSNGKFVHFMPGCSTDLRKWLRCNNVINVRNSED